MLSSGDFEKANNKKQVEFFCRVAFVEGIVVFRMMQKNMKFIRWTSTYHVLIFI